MLPGDVDGMIAGVRVGPVLHPAVLLAFPDRPSIQSPDRCPHNVRHSDRSWTERIRRKAMRSIPEDSERKR
jgi:hypothetical protein